MSKTIVLPSGETSSDIQVPSLVVNLIVSAGFIGKPSGFFSSFFSSFFSGSFFSSCAKAGRGSETKNIAKIANSFLRGSAKRIFIFLVCLDAVTTNFNGSPRQDAVNFDLKKVYPNSDTQGKRLRFQRVGRRRPPAMST